MQVAQQANNSPSKTELALDARLSAVSAISPRNMIGLGQANDQRLTRLCQEFLKEKGMYTGEIDGKCGKLTRQAIKAFQRTNPQLNVDGIIGIRTAAAMLGKPLPPRPQRTNSSPQYTNISSLHGKSMPSGPRFSLGTRATIGVYLPHQTQSSEEGLSIIGVDPRTAKRNADGSFRASTLVSKYPITVSASTDRIGHGYGDTGLAGVDRDLLISVRDLAIEFYAQTGQKLRITGGRELGSRTKGHAQGPGGHLAGKGLDIDRTHALELFLAKNPDFGGRFNARYGQYARMQGSTNNQWVAERTHFDVKAKA